MASPPIASVTTTTTNLPSPRLSLHIMRSPSFRLSSFESTSYTQPSLPFIQEDRFELDDAEDSEAGSETAQPLPVSLARNLRRYQSHAEELPQEKDSTPEGALGEQANPDSMLSILVYGLVNVAVSVPCLYGYAGIIYRHPVFQPALPDLTKLVILSSAVHQLVFCYKSSMSFSIAQVQDAGLIFLSTMATTIAQECETAEEAVATTVVSLSLCTTLLGVVVVVVGRFKLASFVSLIPMPVVAGYLAFIGFFCLAAGLGLSCSKDVSSYRDFALLNSWEDWMLAAPALGTGVMLTWVSRKGRDWKALPITITAIPVFFFIVLFAFSIPLDEARNGGWVAELDPPRQFYEVFTRFEFAKVNWSILPKLVVTWASMTVLVTFASALDVVAVEMDLGGKELDVDKELETVGISNVVSGLFGGYTGSYIFSMTIFTRRTGSQTRWIGLFLAGFELVLFLAPFNLMSFVPRFFFAGTLIFIAFDLMAEWLFAVYFRVSGREFGLVLITFLAITFSEDLVLGILIGSLAAIVNFISLYSMVDPVVAASNRSNVLRDFEARKILHELNDSRITSLKLNGFLFFGSTTLLLSRVRGFLTKHPGDGEEENGGEEEYGGSENGGSEAALSEASPLIARQQHQRKGKIPRSASVNDISQTIYNTMSRIFDSEEDLQQSSLARTSTLGDLEEGEDSAAAMFTKSLVPRGMRFLVLDFSNVTNIDATAASTGLMRIRMLAEAHQVKLVFCGLAPEFQVLFTANHVLDPPGYYGAGSIAVKQTSNDALDYCESELLEEAKTHREVPITLGRVYRYPNEPHVPGILFDEDMQHVPAPDRKRAEKMARASLSLLVDTFFGWGKGTPSLSPEQSKRLSSYFTFSAQKRGSMIFDAGQDATGLYVVLSGEVMLFKPSEDWLVLLPLVRKQMAERKEIIPFGTKREHLQRARYGSMIGDLGFTLQERRTFGAYAESDTALFMLSRSRYAQLEREEPQLAVGLLKMVGRSLGMTLSNLQQLPTDLDA
ncbi:hypothetical protein BASA81_003892 [Batrachochytrium salamandrivorans]|nr:hypothetical protein BASA81_003892 [Batrachochytrium salamandrivorans]